jgi:hypothetical protein
MAKDITKDLGLLLRSAVGTLVSHKILLFPFAAIAFLQLLVLELLYFYPRFPLKIIFGPLVHKLWAEEFLHYPQNFLLLPKLFQYSQIPFFIFVGSLFIAVAILMVQKENSGERVSFRQVLGEVLPQYVHIVVAALIMFFGVWIFFMIYGRVYERALQIRSTSGIFYNIKAAALYGAPYVNLLWSVTVTALFAYVFPIIVIGKKKVFSAIWQNFRLLRGSFWLTFGLVLLPSLLYFPVLWLRNIFSIDRFAPEATVIILAISVMVTVFIDAVVYTGLTIRYLWKLEKL